eukprot:Nk52_evm2s180 gene=Nk52_evmTU2s180
MLEKHFTTIMSVTCIIMILVMAVAPTQASPILGNDRIEYSIEKILFLVQKQNSCAYYLKRPCNLTSKIGNKVTCSIVDEKRTQFCEEPKTKSVTFKRLSDTQMGMEGLDIPNKYKRVASEGVGNIERFREAATVTIYGPGTKPYDFLTIFLKQVY